MHASSGQISTHAYYGSEKDSCSMNMSNCQLASKKRDISSESSNERSRSRPTSTSQRELATCTCHIRQMGLGHNSGLQDRIPKPPYPDTPTEDGRDLQPRTGLGSRGNCREKSDHGTAQVRTGEGFLFNSFLVLKGRRHKTSNRSQMPQQIYSSPPLQDGENDWMTKVDLKDAYFMISIHEEDRKVLRFSAQDRLFQFNCLPFGLSSAP